MKKPAKQPKSPRKLSESEYEAKTREKDRKAAEARRDKWADDDRYVEPQQKPSAFDGLFDDVDKLSADDVSADDV